MKISVIGMGYVGAVCSACLSEKGHTIIGVDVSKAKVDMINLGRSPLVEDGLGDLLQQGVNEKRISATTNIEEAVKNTDISMICVGTPSSSNGNLDLTYIKKVSEDIGKALRDKDSYHLVVIRSTVLPGTTMSLIVNILEKSSLKRLGVDFGLSMNPEFLRESTAIKDFFYPPMIVIGEYDERSGDIVQELYAGIDAPVIRKSIEVAECIKYTCNVWHALKVSFANEIGSISKALGIDGREVMEVVCTDKKLNVSSHYMKPGFSFGGSCLPKDVRALSYRATQLDVEVPLIKAIMPSNKSQMDRGFELVTALGKKNIGLLGLSFKAGTDDLRESPLVTLVERLIGKGYTVSIHDENIEIARMHGANKEYINSKIPHISRLLNNDMGQVIEQSDIIVIGNGDNKFSNAVMNIANDKFVVDLYGQNIERSDLASTGICW